MNSLSPASVWQRLALYAKLIRIDKPIGTLLLLWPTLWALWIAARGSPDARTLAIFVLGTFLMRSAGCAINDFADRDFDGHVERTRQRPLAARLIAPWEALVVAAVLALIAFALVLQLNSLTVGLAFVAAFVAASYPFTKRFFAIPQAYLGIAFGFGIPMAFAAVTGWLPLTAWLLLAANISWAIAYDTEYAMVDREDDRRLGIHTSALTFGRFDVSAVMLCYALTLLLLAWVGAREKLGIAYFVGLSVAAAIALYHHRLIRHRDRAGCFRAFRHNNWFGGAIFLGCALDLYY